MSAVDDQFHEWQVHDGWEVLNPYQVSDALKTAFTAGYTAGVKRTIEKLVREELGMPIPEQPDKKEQYVYAVTNHHGNLFDGLWANEEDAKAYVDRKNRGEGNGGWGVERELVRRHHARPPKSFRSEEEA